MQAVRRGATETRTDYCLRSIVRAASRRPGPSKKPKRASSSPTPAIRRSPTSISRRTPSGGEDGALLVKDPGHFAIGSGRLYVVTAAVAGDREGFQGEVFSVTLARESVRAAKFLIAGEPAEYRGSGRHRGIGTDGPEAFTVEEPLADRFSDPDVITGRRTAVFDGPGFGRSATERTVSLICQCRKKALTRQWQNRAAEFWQTY